jgi:2-isopropylmalate synthase
MKPPKKSSKKTSKPAAAPRRAAPSHDGAHLIHDWNADGPRPGKRLEFVDETLRDGLQCPSVTDPPIEKKVEILRLMVALGIQCRHRAAGRGRRRERARRDALEGHPRREAADPPELRRAHRHPRHPARRGDPAARRDPARRLDVHRVERDPAVRRGLDPREDGAGLRGRARLREARARADHLRDRGHDARAPEDDQDALRPRDGLRREGADRLRHGRARDAERRRRLVKFVVAGREERSKAKIEWHGHMDRGLGVSNSIAAFEAGADRVHGTGSASASAPATRRSTCCSST